MSVNIKTRTKILNSLVRSRLLYSCQTWCCTKAQMSQINSTYLSFLRKMIKGGYRRKEDSWAYVFTNNELLQMAGTEDIFSFVGRQRASFVKKAIQLGNSSKNVWCLMTILQRNAGQRWSYYPQTWICMITQLTTVYTWTHGSNQDLIVKVLL